MVKPGLYSFLIGWRRVLLLETRQQRLYWEEVRKLAIRDGFRGFVAEILDWLYELSELLLHLAHSCGKGRRGKMGLKITLRVVQDCGVGVVKRREPWSLCDLLSPPLLLCLSNQLFPDGRTTYASWSSGMWSNLATIRFAHSHKRYPPATKRIGMRIRGVIDNWNHKLS